MGFLERIDRFLPKHEYGELYSTLHSFYYFVNLEGRARSKRYPRLSKEVMHKIMRKTDSGLVIPVRASRNLTMDLGFDEFCGKVEEIILERGGKVSKLETERIAQKIINEFSTGHMYESIGTNPQLAIESGTLGVVTDLDPDYYPARMVVFWPGLNIEGYWAQIPCVSRQPGKEYDLEIFFDESPADLGITDEIIQQQKLDFDRAFQDFLRR